MFTGIISEVGTVRHIVRMGDGRQISVRAPRSSGELHVHDSVSINGVCLTVIKNGNEEFTVEAVEETLRKTTVGDFREGLSVNLELALRPIDRLGGHLVQGHVDGVGIVRSITKKENSWLVSVEIPPEFSRYVIPVGSIAIDGVSLTAAGIENTVVTVSIIPHTMENTNVSGYRSGTRVNIEFDLIGKYIERLMSEGGKPSDPVSREKLREWGYDV